MTDHERPTNGDDATPAGDLTRQLFATLTKADASILEAHGAIFHACLESLDRVLAEAAAVGELDTVQPWLREQLDALYFYVLAWRPGASPAEAALEALSGRTDGRTH